jgi:hypothetical protein
VCVGAPTLVFEQSEVVTYENGTRINVLGGEFTNTTSVSGSAKVSWSCQVPENCDDPTVKIDGIVCVPMGSNCSGDLEAKKCYVVDNNFSFGGDLTIGMGTVGMSVVSKTSQEICLSVKYPFTMPALPNNCSLNSVQTAMQEKAVEMAEKAEKDLDAAASGFSVSPTNGLGWIFWQAIPNDTLHATSC